jgi:hypothetical protein
VQESIQLHQLNQERVLQRTKQLVRKLFLICLIAFILLYVVHSLYKEDVLFQGDVTLLPEYQSQPDIPTYLQETTKVPETKDKSGMKAFWDVFLNMTDFNLLKDKRMVIICAVKIYFSLLLKSIFLSFRLMSVQ